jgi:hypothetical protein
LEQVAVLVDIVAVVAVQVLLHLVAQLYQQLVTQ